MVPRPLIFGRKTSGCGSSSFGCWRFPPGSGILAAVLGRKRAGALRWYHWGWLPVFWGALELVRVGLLLILAAVPPENVFFAFDGTVWEACGPHLLLAAAAGLAVFCAEKRHAARREAKSQT